MQLPLLLLFSVSMTVSCKSDKLKEDHSSCQWNGNDLYKANTQFAVSLYKLVSSKTASAPPNFFISPISIYTSLAMLALGARSSTQQQILGTMCLNGSQGDEILKDEFKNFLDKLTKQKDGKFKFFNWLFLEKSIVPEIQYQQDLVSYYGAHIHISDFRDPLNAKRRINEQVRGQTDGKIEDLVSDVDNSTMIAVMDYAVFDGESQSGRSYTQRKTFNHILLTIYNTGVLCGGGSTGHPQAWGSGAAATSASSIALHMPSPQGLLLWTTPTHAQ